MATGIVSFHTDSDRVRMRNEIRAQIVAKLSDKEYRDIFVSEQINTGLAFQISAMREQRGWTQSELGEKAGMAQSRISLMEDANYSRFSLSTLKRLASAFDVALVVRFEPFSKLVGHFASLDSSSLNVASFEDDAFYPETSPSENLAALNVRGYEPTPANVFTANAAGLSAAGFLVVNTGLAYSHPNVAPEYVWLTNPLIPEVPVSTSLAA